MPLYEYICTACQHSFEEMQKFSDAPIRKCPKCGKSKVTKQVSLSGFQLKGSGWYKDGYNKAADKPADSATKGDSKSGDSKSADSKSPAPKPETKSGDTKTTAKPETKPAKADSSPAKSQAA